MCHGRPLCEHEGVGDGDKPEPSRVLQVVLRGPASTSPSPTPFSGLWASAGTRESLRVGQKLWVGWRDSTLCWSPISFPSECLKSSQLLCRGPALLSCRMGWKVSSGHGAMRYPDQGRLLSPLVFTEAGILLFIDYRRSLCPPP